MKPLSTCLVAFTLCCIATPSSAGRNAGGAIIVHTNDAYGYSSGTACTTPYALPTSCEQAITRSDKSEGTVVWLLAAFPDTSSPSVSVIYFGIDYSTDRLTPTNWRLCGPPGSLEVPDGEWPFAGFGNSVAFPEPVYDEHLFPLYVLEFEDVGAADGAEDLSPQFSTTANPTGGYAAYVDSSNPPVLDAINRFGSIHWYEPGLNSCPQQGASNEGEDSVEGDSEDPTDVLSIRLEAELVPKDFHDGREYPIEETYHIPERLLDVLASTGATHIAKAFPGWEPGENVRIDRRGLPVKLVDLSGFFHVRFPDSTLARNARFTLMRTDGIRTAEYKRQGTVQALPWDEYFLEWPGLPDPQWHLHNTGARGQANWCPHSKPGFDLHVEHMDSYPRQGGVMIAMVDTGLLDGHNDLNVEPTNGAYQNHPGEDWCHVHGTRMSGLAAAWTNRVPQGPLGVAGVCGGCKLLDVEASTLKKNAQGIPFCNCAAHNEDCATIDLNWDSKLMEAVEDWHGEYGIRVANLALTVGPYANVEEMLVLWNSYLLGVASVGARGDTWLPERRPMFPASFPFVLGVGGYNHAGRLWVPSTSCYPQTNKGTTLGPGLDICAPACPEMVTTDPYGWNITTAQTSGACSIVSGTLGHLATLASDVGPGDLSADDLVGLIEGTALPWGDDNPADYCGCVNCTPSDYGKGKLNFPLASRIVEGEEQEEGFHGLHESAFVKGGVVRFPDLTRIDEGEHVINTQRWRFYRYEAEVYIPPSFDEDSPPYVAWPNQVRNCREDATTTLTGFQDFQQFPFENRLNLALDGVTECTMIRLGDGRARLIGFNYKNVDTGDWLVPEEDLQMAYTYYTKGNTGVADLVQDARLSVLANPNPASLVTITVTGTPGTSGTVDVYDAGGRHRASRSFLCGSDAMTTITLEARDHSGNVLENGLYFVRATSKDGTRTTTKMTLMP